jgi:chromosome segregation ATPase
LLAPQEYDAQLVFEVVRQVIQEKIEDSSTHTLKKVSDTIAEVIVEERKAWKQAYNAVTSDYHRFKVEAGNWSKRFAVEMAELSAQVNDLNNQMVVAKAEVKRLETENNKLRIKGTLGKSPRKVKVS